MNAKLGHYVCGQSLSREMLATLIYSGSKLEKEGGDNVHLLFWVPERIRVSAEMHANWMLDPEAVVCKACQSPLRKRVGDLFFSCFLGTKPWLGEAIVNVPVNNCFSFYYSPERLMNASLLGY